MAIILEENNVYIKIEKDIESDIVFALIKEYKNKETRELEKQYGEFKEYLTLFINNQLNIHYDRMLNEAIAMNIVPTSGISKEEIDDLRKDYPSFDIAYTEYHTLNNEEYLLGKYFLDPSSDVPDLPKTFNLLIQNQEEWEIETYDDFSNLLKACNPQIVSMKISIPEEITVDVPSIYDYIKRKKIFNNPRDDL